MENANCFGDAHRFVFELIARGDVDGLRLDHIDGLFDPIGYCDLLRSRAELLGQQLYVVIEKILAPNQELLARWNVDGTTGYEFMNAVTGLAVDGRNERAIDRVYQRFTRDLIPFDEVAFAAKQFVLETALSAELNVLALRLDRLAQRDAHTRDFTLGALRRGLVATVAAFPVYRTYVTGAAVEPADRRIIESAIAVARARDASNEGSVYAFLRRVLLAEHADERERERYVEFAMRFQQLTAPVMAKGVEDTAFYRSLRLIALNEVGGDPARFGTTVDEFHRQNASRALHHPHALLATATHDMKRGEDVRARLAVLSEMPHEWRRALARWTALNREHRTIVSLLDEYGIYQTMLGAWPMELLAGELDAQALASLADRIAAYSLKAAREAKLSTSWTNPDADYERALDEFVRSILDPQRSPAFLESLRGAARSVAATGLTNSLAQVVLKATAPGVPDTYQGTELWDLSLVDPDNRRPVDFTLRANALRALDDAIAAGHAARGARARAARDVDGRANQAVRARNAAAPPRSGELAGSRVRAARSARHARRARRRIRARRCDRGRAATTAHAFRRTAAARRRVGRHRTEPAGER